MEKFKPLTEEESKEVSPIVTQIYDIISKKVVNEMKPCDKNNPTYLGDIKFYFMTNGHDSYLVWDKHVNEWDEKRIKEDILALEQYIARLRGLIE